MPEKNNRKTGEVKSKNLFLFFRLSDKNPQTDASGLRIFIFPLYYYIVLFTFILTMLIHGW